MNRAGIRVEPWTLGDGENDAVDLTDWRIVMPAFEQSLWKGAVFTLRLTPDTGKLLTQEPDGSFLRLSYLALTPIVQMGKL